MSSKSVRYWYTIMGSYAWASGWGFGETPESAALDAVERETKTHPLRLGDRPLRVGLQSVPDYDREAEEPTQYHTVIVTADGAHKLDREG